MTSAPSPLRLLAVLALVPVLVLAACGGEDGDTVARDTGSGSSSPPERPTRIPAADGLVHTPNLATVMDTGTPELCLGAVAESYPPQCSGPAIENWDWEAMEGVFEQQGEIRWGMFHVTGRWDGETFTLTEAVPAALYDAVRIEPSTPPSPQASYTEAELLEIQDGLSDLPGYLSSYPAAGQLLVEVVHDDGSIQDWADATYGVDVLVFSSVLAPVEG